MPREIKILGVSCSKCDLLYENVVMALEELGLDANIIKVKDPHRIALEGILITPGLMVDGKIISQGKVLSVEELKDILKS
ncbi:MAG: thioredoxin family protein [Caldimicrobium sp.]|nr:thioredoxin family protein [Caldimicrobium sp.]MCX7613202.1 thioredoxin family protein [Caldimicrobium sp.]MDW8182496.1 thioredoxin family protein [Caldimicrobium sp.]